MSSRRPLMQQARLAVLCGVGTTDNNGIVAFGFRLTAALNATGQVHAAMLRLDSRECWGRGHLPAGFDAYLLQYNPFAFGRWGFAPWLPVAWQRLRRQGEASMVLTIHEAYSPMRGWRDTTMGLWQRAQLLALLRATDLAIATCRERSDQVGAFANRSTIQEVPIGSNIDVVADPAKIPALRDRLRGPGVRPIIGTFGNAHPSRLIPLIEGALRRLGEVLGEYVVLNLGTQPPTIAVPDGVELIAPGHLTVEDVAVYLSCTDLVLLPYINGAITNKGTLMAALQLGLPVVSTRGPSTDDVLLGGGLCLVDVRDSEGYAAAAAALMRDSVERESLGRRGRSLYEREFAWDVIARRTIEALGTSTMEGGDRKSIGGQVTLDHGVP